MVYEEDVFFPEILGTFGYSWCLCQNCGYIPCFGAAQILDHELAKHRLDLPLDMLTIFSSLLGTWILGLLYMEPTKET